MKLLREKILKAIVWWKLHQVTRMHGFSLKKGIALNNDGDYQKAIAYFDLVLARDPMNPLAWNFKGGALLKFGKYREAREAFQNFVKYAPPKYAKYVSEAEAIIRDLAPVMRAGKSMRSEQ